MSFGFRTSKRRPRYGLVAMLTLTALLGLQSGALARFQTTLDAPSPATGHASVIAQGVAELPFDPIAWRVVLDTAEPLDVAQPVERALGFVVADPDGVHVIDVGTGVQERLAPGEASFVPEAAAQIRASLTESDTNYLRVALVADVDVNDPGNDQMVFAGAPFAAPEGRRDIDLLRDVLAEDEESQIAGGDYPTLIIATGGAIEVDAGDQPVTLQAGEAAEFSGDITVRGVEAGSSFVAGVIGPDVPVPPRTSGTITVATYLCAPGVEPSDLGDPADDAVAADCAPVSGDSVPTLTDPDGAELTIDDAETVRDGAYAWVGAPFGDYTVNAPATLPAGASDPTYYDRDGNLLGSGDLTIDRDNPDAHVDIYLFQSGSGTVAITGYLCPDGWSPGESDVADCEPSSDGFDITFVAGDDEGGQFSLTDADVADGSYVWTGLGLSSTSEALAAGYYLVNSVDMPNGYSQWHMEGAQLTSSASGSYVNLTPDAPSADLSIYFYNESTDSSETNGTITLDTVECPSVDSAPQECSRTVGPTGVGGVFIQDVNGEYGALTEANAAQEGDGPLVWANVPLAAYFMETSGLTAPDGYQIVSVVLTPDGADVSNGFTLSEDNTIANVVVLLTPIGGGANETDSDNDGLIDSDEATYGTDPANPDSDGDCHADGPEVTAGTNPLDGTSFPEGDCDSIEATDEN